MSNKPATIADVQAAVNKAYQVGRLEVIGQVNIQRVRALKERYDDLLMRLKTGPNDELARKLTRLHKQLLRACKVGVRNEEKLRALLA